jgi:hypothetical protein
MFLLGVESIDLDWAVELARCRGEVWTAVKIIGKPRSQRHCAWLLVFLPLDSACACREGSEVDLDALDVAFVAWNIE